MKVVTFGELMVRLQPFNYERFVQANSLEFTFGGGESDDREVRSAEEHGIWFKEELPTPDQLAVGAHNLDAAGLKVDYIITHEPPLLVKSSMLLRRGLPERVNKLNGYFEELAKSVEFNHWYFGSLHENRLVTSKFTCLFDKIIPLGSKEQP